MIARILFLSVPLVLSVLAMSARSEPVRLHAAGSLNAALTEVSAAFFRREGQIVEQACGPSGLLRDRIAGGEAGHVFASARMRDR